MNDQHHLIIKRADEARNMVVVTLAVAVAALIWVFHTYVPTTATSTIVYVLAFLAMCAAAFGAVSMVHSLRDTAVDALSFTAPMAGGILDQIEDDSLVGAQRPE